MFRFDGTKQSIANAFYWEMNFATPIKYPRFASMVIFYYQHKKTMKSGRRNLVVLNLATLRVLEVAEKVITTKNKR